MEEKMENFRMLCIDLCDRLSAELDRNKDEAAACLGGDIYKAYVQATEEAINKTRKTKNKIRNI